MSTGIGLFKIFVDRVSDGTRIAYFRGRKLHGRAVKLPDGYRGAVVEKRAPPPPAAQPEHDATDLQQEEAEEHVPLGSLEAKAEIEELVVWGHEAMADAASDPYMRIEEWTQMAEQVPPISLWELTPGIYLADPLQIHSYPAVEKGS